jgi:hypothetical protein
VRRIVRARASCCDGRGCLRRDRRLAEHRDAVDEGSAVYTGYYDHHIRTYLITEVSPDAQAKAMHINYSSELKGVKGLPKQYFVGGRAAHSQLTVFGSELGKSDYNPLEDEFWVTWKKGVKLVLLGQDYQIDSLATKGEPTVKDAHIVLNAPILKNGRGG